MLVCEGKAIRRKNNAPRKLKLAPTFLLASPFLPLTRYGSLPRRRPDKSGLLLAMTGKFRFSFQRLSSQRLPSYVSTLQR